MSNKLLFLISFVLVLFPVGNVLGYDTMVWDNDSGDRLWDTVTNWQIYPSPHEKVPTAADWALIGDRWDANASNGPIVDANTNAEARWVSTDAYYNPPSGEVVLTVEGGTVTCTESFDMGYYMPGYYRLEINDGTVDTGGYFYIGFANGSNATVNMSGGTLNTTGHIAIGTAYSEQGTFNMMGGDVNNPGWFRIGDFSNPLRPGKGHANIHGGTVETALLAIGPEGTMDITEGTLIMDGDYRGPNGYLFDPLSDDPNSGGGNYTGTIATLADSGRITAYNTNIGDIITDGNYPDQEDLRAVVKMDYDVSNPGQTTLTGDAVDLSLAWNPTPLSGSTGYSKGEVDLISWSAGDDANSHDVYFGTSFDDVNDATTTVTLGVYKDTQELGEVNYPISTTWNTNYFWRIDEVNGESTWKGMVWNFTTKPAWATEPNPSDGAGGVPPINTDLSWKPGPEAASVNGHQVYFSSDFNDVNDRLIPYASPEANSYSLSISLELDTTYYWAVDEVNNLEDPNLWLGQIWSFTTSNHLIVDDMESYDLVDNPIAYVDEDTGTWKDGWPLENGSYVYLDTSIARQSNNSMRYVYINTSFGDNGYGSWAEADIADLQIDPNWTHSGSKALWLYFYGDPDNSTTSNDKMYVALSDGTNTGVSYYPDVNDINEPWWHQWTIDLVKDFNEDEDVDLTNISKISIGFGTYGGSGSAGGEGTVYFDTLEVWPPRCRSGLVLTDITDDCITDDFDLEVMTSDWLQYDYNVPAVPISFDPVGWWKLDEGTGTSTEDSSEYNNDGDIYDEDWTTGYPGDPCDTALHFDADSEATFDRVICAKRSGSNPGNYPDELMPETFTVACWAKLDSFEYYGTLVTNGYDDDGLEQSGFHLFSGEPAGSGNFGLGIRTEVYMNYVYTPAIYKTGTWYHVAATYDDANNVNIYVDGLLAAGPTDVGGPIRWVGYASQSYPEYFVIGGLPVPDTMEWYYVNGTIDDVRVYNYAMPHGEIVTLAEQEPAAYHPVTSKANIYDLESKLSKRVNFADFAILADHWLEGPVLWPLP